MAIITENFVTVNVMEHIEKGRINHGRNESEERTRTCL